MDNPKKEMAVTPMLFPYQPEAFWKQMRKMIREEISRIKNNNARAVYSTPGLNQKPPYKVEDLYNLFQVSKPTIYDWIKHRKLKPLGSGQWFIFLDRYTGVMESVRIGNIS